MTVKIEAEGRDYHDAMEKLGMPSRPPIAVRFYKRPGDILASGDVATGTECMIDADGYGRREFPDAQAALAFLTEVMGKREEATKRLAEQLARGGRLVDMPA